MLYMYYSPFMKYWHEHHLANREPHCSYLSPPALLHWMKTSQSNCRATWLQYNNSEHAGLLSFTYHKHYPHWKMTNNLLLIWKLPKAEWFKTMFLWLDRNTELAKAWGTLARYSELPWKNQRLVDVHPLSHVVNRKHVHTFSISSLLSSQKSNLMVQLICCSTFPKQNQHLQSREKSLRELELVCKLSTTLEFQVS